MNTGCQERLELRRRLETALREWGWFDAYKRDVKILPVGHQRAAKFQKQVKNAESELAKAHYTNAEQMGFASCSRGLIMPDSVSVVREELKQVSEKSGI